MVRDLPELLRPGDVLVFNDTKVIPGQLRGRRERDGHIANIVVTLIERIDDADWWALAKPGKRLAVGDRIRFGHESRVCLLGSLEATVAAKAPDGRVRLAFEFHGAYLDEAIASARRRAAAALYRAAPRRRRPRPLRLPDRLRRARGRGRRADGRPAFHKRAASAA